GWHGVASLLKRIQSGFVSFRGKEPQTIRQIQAGIVRILTKKRLINRKCGIPIPAGCVDRRKLKLDLRIVCASGEELLQHRLGVIAAAYTNQRKRIIFLILPVHLTTYGIAGEEFNRLAGLPLPSENPSE